MLALVAYGYRMLLGIHISAQESEASWTEPLSELVARHAGPIAAARNARWCPRRGSSGAPCSG